MTVRYDRATRDGKGPQPGLIAVRDHWRKVTGLADQGIYNYRPVRGGGSLSVHAEGRAVDLKANAFVPQEADKAERYVAFLIANDEALQLQYLIWNRRSWKSGRGWRRYGGKSPHTDHVHAELNRDGARDVTLDLLDRLWAGTPTDPDDEEFLMSSRQHYVRTVITSSYIQAGQDVADRKVRQAIEKWVADFDGKGNDGLDGGFKFVRDKLGL